MATNEALFWGRMVEALWRPERVLLRVESGISDGVPDSYYTIDGVSGWMELKAPATPAREQTALFGSAHKLSISQRNWLLTHRQAGGRGWIAIETEGWVLLVGARHADLVNTSSLKRLRSVADFSALRPMNAQDWTTFTRTLIDTPAP